jgi:hypothetical protein
MRAYIYQADILCESCAREVMDDLRARGLEPTDPVLREDSGTWPVGPFPNGGAWFDFYRYLFREVVDWDED